MDQKIFTLKNVILVDPNTNYQGLGSIAVKNGRIESVNGKSIGKEIDCKKAFLAPGIIDIGVKICEPGERHKESFKSAAAAAAAGGPAGRDPPASGHAGRAAAPLPRSVAGSDAGSASRCVAAPAHHQR